MAVSCLDCVNSACCRLEVNVSRDEYSRYKSLGMTDLFETFAEKKIRENPEFAPLKHVIDESTNDDDYAELKKGDDGYCLKLDRETMLCSIYDKRPSVCSWYTNDRCEEIRLICLQ